MNIKDAQRDRIVRMLSMSTGAADETPSENQFKVLVFDKFGQDVIAPLMKVGALRNQGVTLHLQLHADRHTVPDVAAVYFVEPTVENITRIIEDVRNNTYNLLYVNFASSISAAMLESFAKGVASVINGASPIAQVVDRYVNFISLGPTVCSLNFEDSYYILNAAQEETAVMHFVEQCAVGIVSVVTTLGVLPVIRAAPGVAAEMVARKVEEKLRELLQSGTALAQQLNTGQIKGSDGSRPVLIILDRDMDLLCMLTHTWTYQAMIHDVLHMKLNAVKVVNENNETVNYDLDASDAFFSTNRYEPFPEVGTAVHAEIENYTKKRQGMNQPDDEGFSAIGRALNSLPQMTEKKRSIDMHTNLAMALLKEIKARGLDKFYQLENQWSSGASATNSAISELRELLNGEQGTLKDKTRALMALYLSKPDTPTATIDALAQELSAQGADIRGLQVLKQNMSVKSLLSPRPVTPVPIVPAVTMPSFVPSQFKNVAAGLTKQAGGLLASGMNQLQAITASKKKLPIETVVQSLMDNKEAPNALTEKYLYIDPKTTQKQIRVRSAFSNAIVFAIGGGNFIESEALDLFAQKTNRNIVYGATDIISPEDFADQLHKLSR
eukprot:GEMP01008382.1.p1 GENE.GEMP01008382.1~~GEMP01008382.1.p1  ORF type:complete len:610 (+),score=118.78 GEMP01008382.1:120-1949(+)